MTQLYNKPALKSHRKSLRKNMPYPEARLWYFLKNRQLKNYRFRRQYSVGSYILDFYCPALKLGIEIDGDSHFNDKAVIYDSKREAYLKRAGINTLRFTNLEIQENIDGVIERLLNYLP
jgi:very-short-patch-repair endonuclease